MMMMLIAAGASPRTLIDRSAEFWRLINDVWNEGLWGVDVSQILIALGIFSLFALLRHPLAGLILRQLRFVARKTTTKFDDRLIDAIESPIRLLPLILGIFLASTYISAGPELTGFFYNLNRSLVAYLLFWSIYRMLTPLGGLMEDRNRFLTDAMVQWTVKAARVAVVIIGAAAILEVWGIQVGPLVAGLGLFGVAVALGAQDLFKNLIAGLFIISERRFHTGDWIIVGGEIEGRVRAIGFRTTTVERLDGALFFIPNARMADDVVVNARSIDATEQKRYKAGDWVLVDGLVEGTVEEIGERDTLVRRFDKAPVYVPNAQMAQSAVINFSRMTHRRIRWLIGVEYGTTVDQLKEIRDGIEAYILDNDAFAKPDEVSTFVRIDSFNSSSIDILVYCFTRTTVWGEWLAIKEAFAYEIKRIVEGAGTGFAFPSQSIYVESLPGQDKPEPFTVPDDQKKVSP